MTNSVATTSEPLQVVANKMKIGKAERRFAEGKWWLVAPITTIPLDGILNGSKGPGFYPAAETMASVKAWDGMPLTSFHPMDEMGRHTSAGAPGVLGRQGIGIVRDSVWKNKLQHRGWFDEERVKQVNPTIYANLKSGTPIETSTGLYTDNEVAPQGSNHNGRPYTWVARNYRPDHIAVLVGQVGACILPGQEIQGRLVKGSKAWYTGEAIRIWTGLGEVLAITTNHPILTPGGFIPAGQLTEGQDILHYIGESKPATSYDDKYNAPALAENVFETLERLLGTKEVKVPSVLDFHGDAAFFQGDVEVVLPKSTLGLDGVWPDSKGLHQGGFQRRGNSHPQLSRSGPLHQPLYRMGLADVGRVGDGCEPPALFASQSRVHQHGCLGGVSGNSGFSQPLVDDSVVDTGILTDVKGTLTLDIGSDDGLDEFRRKSLVKDSLLPQFCVFGPGAELDVSLLETVSNRRVVESELFRQLLHTFPGKVTLDKIVRVDRFSHDGPVYDFETTTGYMIAQRLVVSNCSLNDGCGVLVNVAGNPITATKGLVVNQSEVTLSHWVENSCECGGKCKPSLNSLTINPFVSESQRRACYAADDPNWDCEEWSDATPKGRKLPEKKPGVENLLGSLGDLRIRPSLLQVLNYDPNEARGEGGKWVYTGGAGDRGKTLHRHSQAAHEAVAGLAAGEGLSKHLANALSTSESATRESSIGNHASASKYHLAAATQLNQAANKVGRDSFWHRATLGLIGKKGNKEAADKIREAATKHMYAGGEAGGSVGFGDANKLTEEAHEATKGADKHKVAWLHHAAVNAHLKASQAWRNEADKQGDEGLKKVLGSIASDHQKQAWEHGKSASQAEVGGSTKAAPKAGEKKYEFLKPSTNQLGLRPTLMEVENFNPFHDIRGKFAAAGGAIGAGIGATIGRTYGGLKERTWGRKLPIAFGEAYSKRGRNRGRDIGEEVGSAVGGAIERSATKVAGLASTGWDKTKVSLASLGTGVLDKTTELAEGAGGRLARVVPTHFGIFRGLKAAGRVSSATLLHGLAGGKEALTEAIMGKPSLYSPSVSPTDPSKTGRFGAGEWGPEYYGAVGSTSAKGVHTFSLDAQKASTSSGINLLVTGEKANIGIKVAQEAYRDAQLGNHGKAAEKHVKAAELLQKSADGLKSWHLQALQREAAKLTKKAADKARLEHEQKPGGLETPAPITPAVPIPPKALRKLSDRDKQALLLETAAHKNRLAAIMQGNNPETEPARAQSLAAFAAERAALKKDTSAKYASAAEVNVSAKEKWEKLVASEHNPLYKATYSSLARHHVGMAAEYNRKALDLLKSRRYEGGSLWDKVEEEEEGEKVGTAEEQRAEYEKELRKIQSRKSTKP